jgi:hypothetical protein
MLEGRGGCVSALIINPTAATVSLTTAEDPSSSSASAADSAAAVAAAGSARIQSGQDALLHAALVMLRALQVCVCVRFCSVCLICCLSHATKWK